MIVRILGEGQFDLDPTTIDDLNQLDDALIDAVEANDEERFRTTLERLLGEVRDQGSALADDVLVPSDFVLPSPLSSIHEVRDLLGAEGLVPD